MGFMSSCSKYFLCFFNFIFFIAGGAAVAVGVWTLIDKKSLSDAFISVEFSEASTILEKTDANLLTLISYCMIIAGTLAFIVCFFGYCGAAVESRCLLCIYGMLILIILGLQCVAVGLAYNLNSDAKNQIETSFKSTTDAFEEPSYDFKSLNQTHFLSATWDTIMTQMQCCGFNDYNDFENNTHLKLAGKKVPSACCIKENGILKDQSCPSSPSYSNSYFKKGCYEVITAKVQENKEIIIIIGSSIIFIEILVILMAMYLVCCHWRPQNACVDVSSRQAW